MFRKSVLSAAAIFTLAAMLPAPAGCCRSTEAIPAVPLMTTVWELDTGSLAEVANPKELPGKPVTLLVSPGGRVSGSGGVNTYFGTVKADGEDDAIRFGQIGSTLMAGPGMNYESAFYKALDQARRYRISGGTLTLRDEDGSVVAVLRARQK
ncbi:MAG: META domain-containing protein [Lentisphaeria bacterium]|nr:META domain-containing protein [Lentisphaeria bacterium]